MTNRRVIAYGSSENGGAALDEIAIDQVGSIELVQQGDAMNYSIYRVTSSDGETGLQLWLPHEYGDAERFVAAIEAKRQD